MKLISSILLLSVFSLLSLLPSVFSQEVGETKCATRNGEIICKYFEECVDVPNADDVNGTASRFCMPKGNDVCLYYDNMGTDGKVVAQTSCAPSQSCCYGQCCSFGQTCSKATKGNFFYKGETYNAEELARNDWKLPDGTEIENYPHVCSAIDSLEPTSGIRAVWVPLFGMIIIIASTVLAASRGDVGLAELSSIAAIGMIVCSFFMLFSEMWGWALFSTFVALSAMLAPSNNSVLFWVVLFQLFGFVWMSGAQGFPFSGTMFASYYATRGQTRSQLAASCANYYDHFNYDPNTRSWDNVMQQWGYCSYGFISFIYFLSFTNLMLYFVVLTQTLLKFMTGKASTSDDAKNVV